MTRNNLRRLLVTGSIVAALAIVAPASAMNGGGGPGPNLQQVAMNGGGGA